ncbi:hypothetical protein [Corynebacterium sp. NML 150383]|uniref:hypothetical protein n=1 Tax=Corynebacterium sp. NML 150383 TaxID=2029400 RepID=UPI001177409F|nr:hypothetical protein [Corynebacterium sp. NML 150383]
MRMLPVPMGRSVATAAAALFLAAPAAGAVTVGQGDAVVVNGSECTVGFNGERESFTAAHCGTSGDRVRKVLDDGTWSPAIGTLDTSPRSEETTNDWARIRWDAGVELGPNEYTGDAQVPLDDIRRGETVCYYGWATGAATCGTTTRGWATRSSWTSSPAPRATPAGRCGSRAAASSACTRRRSTGATT